jgi:hypothetical protein
MVNLIPLALGMKAEIGVIQSIRKKILILRIGQQPPETRNKA